MTTATKAEDDALTKAVSTFIAAVIVVPVMVVVSSILNGLVLSNLWAWFVVPTFSLPLLKLPAAMGIGMLVAYLTHNSSYIKDEYTKSGGFILCMVFLSPLFTLFFGWLLHLSMVGH